MKTHVLTDDQVLEACGNGQFGPGIIGEELYARGQAILKARGGGAFGPAIMDPDFAKKAAAARGEQPKGAFIPPSSPQVPDVGDGPYPGEPLDVHPANPWHYVTASGAKMLAQKNGVSYKPKVTRAELIPALVAAGVVPPPVPTDADRDDED